MRTRVDVSGEVAAVLVQHVALHVFPNGELVLAHGANVAVLLLLVVLHVRVAVAFEVADFALEADDARVNALVSSYRCFRSEQFVAKMASIGLREHVNHLLVLPQLPGREELLATERAFESRMGATMELLPMMEEPAFGAEILDGNALETHEGHLAHVVRQILPARNGFEAFQTLDELEALWMLLRDVFLEGMLVPKALVAEGTLRGHLLLVRATGLHKTAISVEASRNAVRQFTGKRYRFDFHVVVASVQILGRRDESSSGNLFASIVL